ncbi:hypothetical protein JHK86_026748 [Glycine max]|nr:hypothetical protein JHK86_026748 [Glycine max]
MGRAPCCEKVGLKKGRWTAEEDETLAKYIQTNGEGSWRSLPKNAGTKFDAKWSLIASHLPGRTDNEIKNYWNSHLSRKIYSFPGASAGIMDTPKVASIPPKLKGGRTSRWAMNKNKTYTQNVNDAINQRPKQTFTQPNSDFTVLDADVADVNEPRIEELEAEVNKCDRSVDESNDEDILGLCQMEGISDILESWLPETTCVVWDLSEEIDNNDMVVRVSDACRDKMASSGEGYSCSSSMALDQHWDWESVIEFNNVVESEACNNWEQQEKPLTWPWEDDAWESQSKNLGETDTQMQNDMVDWFLS